MSEQIVNHKDDFVDMVLTSPYTDSFIWKNIKEKGIYDHYLIYRVRDLKLIKDETLFIDAGANIGNHTVYWAKCFPKATCMAVEANQEVFNVLNRNVELNQLSNVHTVNSALSAKDGLGVCSILDSAHPGNSQVRIGGDFETRTIRVDSVYKKLMSDIGESYKPCSFIKIDCEHHDFEVLLGCESILEMYRPSVAIEIWPEDLCTSRGVAYLKPDVENFLFSKGYTLMTSIGVNNIYAFKE